MKKKLLTVLLAVVMVFGVFGLTACGGSNPDEEYNYYASRYEIEGDIHITAVTYLSVYKMMKTPGNYLLYVDTETSADAKTAFKAINKLANEWGVEIYHFNPVLSGGFHEAKPADGQIANWATSNVLQADIPNDEVNKGIYNLRQELLKLTNNVWADVQDQELLAINGQALGFTNAAALKVEGDDVVVDESVKYKVYNASKKTWGDRSTIKAHKKYDKGAEAIAAVAQKLPSYGQYAPANQGQDIPYVLEAYDTSNINTFNIFGDARFHMYEEGVNDYTAEKEDVFVAVANYAQFAWLLDHNDGHFAVFFGGAWCGNTQAIAYLTNNLAKDYGISKVYFFDPVLDDRAYDEKAEVVVKSEITNADMIAAKKDKTALYEVKVSDGTEVAGYSINTRTMDWAGNARAASAASDYSYSHLYGYFLRDYLDAGKEGGYKSYWNLVENEASSNNLIIKIDGQDLGFGKMCVPNIMMFNGEGEGKAKLVKYAEAEYSYGNPVHEALWTKAVREVFDQNPYASYNPIPVIESSNEEESSSSSSSKAPAADTGSAC